MVAFLRNDEATRMGEGIGSYLQELRTGKQLTTTQLAQKAGIRRATLSDWQSGKRQPRLPELEAVLHALGASEAQRRKARERLRTPKNILRLRKEAVTKNPELSERAGAAPQGGDLLRALRMRKGWTQAILAEKMGVSQATVARWERSEGWPGTESLHTLCYLLEAREEELTALTLGRFSLKEKQTPLTETGIHLQLQAYRETWYSPSEYALTDLRLLSLMADAWPLAMVSDKGRLLLATIQMEYVDHLFMHHRFGECCEVANRTLDLYASVRWQDGFTDRVAVRLAEASAGRGSRQGVENAIALLQQWLPGVSHPTYAGWMLKSLAEFQLARGDREEAVRLARESVKRTGDYEFLHRHYDLVRILLQANRVQEAQEVVEATTLHPYYTLVRAEACLRIGEQSTARHLVQEAMRILEDSVEGITTQPEIAYYRPVAETLAEQLDETGRGAMQAW